MSEAPPSRYKVVERGRRLVVIDSATGEEVTHGRTARERGAAPAPKPSPGMRRTGFDGRARFTTHRFYDLKGPRTLALNPVGADQVRGVRATAVIVAVAFVALALSWPWLLILPVVLAQRPVRDGIRRIATKWLDQFDQVAPTDSSSSAG